MELADEIAPGLVQGLYLQGSIALGDYRAGVSDIDFVAVTARPADPAVLRRLHAALKERVKSPYVDGVYVLPEDLRRDPAEVPDRPGVHEWRVAAAGRDELNLVTWHTLAQGGVTLRGPATATLGVHTNRAGLLRLTEDNLETYWKKWHHETAKPWNPASLSRYTTAWGVLGATRLRHTLEAGEVTSKTDAAEFGLKRYDERWHRVIREALAIRTGGASLYRSPFQRRADMLGYVGTVLRG
ncbi:aminoglycoside adenylyltransferase domain-containing protein [Micromonospora sp. DT43]|uniref:nucleotidyltransferase domain-containing protein n=1 Tax=Micromonospora sp. DT43 TaxID=3393440 RepID=UPI003CF489B3